jgi:hypothetical protein
MYAKINKKLRKLHNPAKGENLLNLHIKTKAKEYSIVDFVEAIGKISVVNITDKSIKNYLKTREDYIFSVDNLPIVLKHKNKKALTIKSAVLITIASLLILPTILNTFGII